MFEVSSGDEIIERYIALVPVPVGKKGNMSL